MTRITRAQNFCAFDKEYSHNGTKYHKDIDTAIVNHLGNCKSVNSSELKRKVAEALGRNVSFRTFSAHIKRMLEDRILKKNDTQQRGKKSVMYAMTEDAKKLKQLRLLRTDPKYDTFKKIYAYLLFCSINHPPCFGTNDLDKLLSDINATRKDLVRESIKKREIQGEFVPSDPNIKHLPYSVTIEYKPISGVGISKGINYYMNYKENKYIISTSYHYVLPGFSPEDFNTWIFNPKSEDLDEACMLLLKCGLIRPLMIFQGKTRYVLADERLNDLIHYLQTFRRLEDNFFDFRLDFYDKPTDEELQRLKFFAGEQAFSIRIHLNRAELSRFDFKKRIKEQKGNGIDKNFCKEKEDIDKMINVQKHNLDHVIEALKEEYNETIKKYPFLHEIISLACPSMLQ